jgi:hypothetical protein
VDGASILGYVKQTPLGSTDSMGLACTGIATRAGGVCAGGAPPFDVIPAIPTNDPPIPPTCTGIISPADWSQSMRAWRRATSECGRAPVITCIPCAPWTPGGLPPCGLADSGGRNGICSITICTNAPAGCGPVGPTIEHELTHCRQGCEMSDQGNPDTIEERICRELEAYGIDGSCAGVPPAGLNRCLCRRACGSVAMPTNACIAKCFALLAGGRCRGGHYQ